MSGVNPNHMIKVAAYCRVSTDKEDQANSFAAQKKYFKEYIERKGDWQITEIYADEGITGTSTEKRVAFTQMMQDAYAGKFSFILTKEVSRFARNTVDTLQYTRKLKERNIGVLFVNDNINSLDPDAELRLSIMASIAQEESRKTSERVKWGMKRRMENGYVISPPILGYDYQKGVLSINPEEAEIVKRIYYLYVDEGMSTVDIARLFEKTKVPKSKRIQSWSPTAIARILRNEKYAGDVLQKKTVTPNFLTHKAVKNNGLEEKIFLKDHHDPIVSRDLWERAQCILKERCSYQGANHNAHNHRYWCSGKILCGVCGGTFVSKVKRAAYGTVRAWKCKHTTFSDQTPDGCTNKTYIDERILKSCMQYVLSKMILNQDEILLSLQEAFASCDKKDQELKNLTDKMDKLNIRRKRIVAYLLDGTMDKEDYKSAIQEVAAQIDMLSLEIAQKNALKKDREKAMGKVQEIITYAQKYLNQEVETLGLYAFILHKMVVHPDHMVCVYLIDGAGAFYVKYNRKGRGAQYMVECSDADVQDKRGCFKP